MILKAFIWISQHGPGGADVSDGPALRFALNARPTASQGEAPATAIGNMGRGQREESSAKGRRVGDSQSNLPALKKKRLHKILDKCCRSPETAPRVVGTSPVSPFWRGCVYAAGTSGHPKSAA